MDVAVGLVQAYLNVNGYFTVTEFPVLEASSGGEGRAVASTSRIPRSDALRIAPT